MIPSYHFPLCEFEVDASIVDFLLPIEISCSYIPHLCMCYWVYINPVQGPQLGKKIMKKLSLSYFKFANKGLNSHFLIYLFLMNKVCIHYLTCAHYTQVIIIIIWVGQLNIACKISWSGSMILHIIVHCIQMNWCCGLAWNKYKDTLKNEIFNIIQSFTFAEVNTMV